MRDGVFLFGVQNLRLGSFISIHPMTYIDATGGLTIGDDVSIAHGVTILSTSHTFASNFSPIREQPVENRPTHIGSNVWIGAGARILGGVTVGDGCVVASGAVLVKDTPPNSIVAGVPARVIRSRFA